MMNINNEVENLITPNYLMNLMGQKIVLKGTIYKIRQMSGFSFIILHCAGYSLQCTLTDSSVNHSLKENMSVAITGLVAEEPRSHNGFEIQIQSAEILSAPLSDAPVVINNKTMDIGLDTLLNYRPLTLRNINETAIFKIQAGVCQGLRQFFEQNNFTEIHSPKITASGAEGGANIFTIDYFGKQAYLAQSPQFYKQIMVGVFERVYEIGPVFRAEKHDTVRHVNEYTSVDMEMGFIHNFYDIMHMEVKMLQYVIDFLQEEYMPYAKLLNICFPTINEIPAIPFIEAKQLISNQYKRKITDFEDFEPEEEKLLCELIKKQTGSDFVFVTHYKASKRPFYAMNTKSDPIYTDSFDLLFRGLEITTGGQRIHGYNEQIEKMQKCGLNPRHFESYLMAHQYGLPPHGGLGLGLERFCMKLINLNNIRRTTLFPRDTNRLEP